MTPIIRRELEVLSCASRDIFELFLRSCVASHGDLAKAEEAMALAISTLRTEIVSAGLRSCVASSASDYRCPMCRTMLTGWGSRNRGIVTSSGEGTFPANRYRCRKCRKDHYPWAVAQGLDEGNQFTLSARQLIAEEASDAAYERSSRRLGRMGIPVSSSEVDQIGREVGLWRKQEQEAVRAYNCAGGNARALPLHRWDQWPTAPQPDNVVTFSVDGGKVRSDQAGPKGLEWFEVRSGIIRLGNREAASDRRADARMVCIGGVMEPDKLFETLRSQWWQAPEVWHQRHEPEGEPGYRLVFVADGAEWIWARAKWYFPRCIQILDIYHAAEHVGMAARAAWGPDSPDAQRWINEAIPRLMEPDGPRSILRELITKLRSAKTQQSEEQHVDQPAELATQFRYLWRHRHRMHYRRWREQGLTIGSGGMESTIKQLSTHRLCQAGMMWTKDHADLMLHLRAACLSRSLELTIERERKIRSNRAIKFRTTEHDLANAA